MFLFQIGFLRKGAIITEKCPKQLISAFGCLTLEEAFFKLSEAQNRSLDSLNANSATETAVIDSDESTSSSSSSLENFDCGSSEVS